MTRVVVTGGSGKAGRACIRDLLAHGYEVANADLVPPAEASASSPRSRHCSRSLAETCGSASLRACLVRGAKARALRRALSGA
jgi:nucleoside-diphosphate-sugar epimerase